MCPSYGTCQSGFYPHQTKIRREREKSDQRYIRQFPPKSLRSPPNPSLPSVLVDNIFQMELNSLQIGGSVHTLEDVDDDGAEAGGVEVDLLVVGDLADVAG